MKVVVYGTLKKGYGNHHFLRDAEYLGDVVVPGYKLFYSYSDKGFPVARECEDSSLKGEIYEIPQDKLGMVSAMDRLEGEGSMYHRTQVLDGTAEMYVGDEKFWDEFHGMVECPKVNDKFVWSRV